MNEPLYIAKVSMEWDTTEDERKAISVKEPFDKGSDMNVGYWMAFGFTNKNNAKSFANRVAVLTKVKRVRVFKRRIKRFVKYEPIDIFW